MERARPSAEGKGATCAYDSASHANAAGVMHKDSVRATLERCPTPERRSPHLPRLGYLGAGDGGPCQVVAAFQQGLADHGLIEGQNIAVEYRFAHHTPRRYAELVDELVQLSVDLIVLGDSAAIPLARQATETIPIVM